MVIVTKPGWKAEDIVTSQLVVVHQLVSIKLGLLTMENLVKLHSLEDTNDKAMERYVVLHSHSCVPDTKIMNDICQSNGCPIVSTKFLKEIQPWIKGSKRPILLWILE